MASSIHPYSQACCAVLRALTQLVHQARCPPLMWDMATPAMCPNLAGTNCSHTHHCHAAKRSIA